MAGHQPRGGEDWRLAPDVLRAIMKDRGLTQGELAARVGVGAPHMSMLLSGRRQPSVRLLGRLAKELQVPVEVLTGRQPYLRPVAAALASALGNQAGQAASMPVAERVRRVLYILLAASPEPSSALAALAANLGVSEETLAGIIFGGVQIQEPLQGQIIRVSGVPAPYFLSGDLSWAAARR